MNFYLKIFGIIFAILFFGLYLIFQITSGLDSIREERIKKSIEKAQMISDCESKGGAMLETASGFKCFKLEIIK